MTLKVVIADDENAVRARLRRLLAAEDDLEVVAECSDGPSTVAAVSRLSPNVLFLDIEMPGLNGFEVIERLQDVRPPVIVFVTAFQEYALRAFDVDATDYLQKPIDSARFKVTWQRIRERIARGSESVAGFQEMLERLAAEQARLRDIMTNANARYLDRIMVRSRERVLFVRTEDVDWFESTGNYVRIHTSKGAHLIRETLSSLEKRLDPARFVRIHRGTVVNLERIKEMQPYFSGDYVVVLTNGAKLKLSRSYRATLDERMGQNG